MSETVLNEQFIFKFDLNGLEIRPYIESAHLKVFLIYSISVLAFNELYLFVRMYFCICVHALFTVYFKTITWETCLLIHRITVVCQNDESF